MATKMTTACLFALADAVHVHNLVICHPITSKFHIRIICTDISHSSGDVRLPRWPPIWPPPVRFSVLDKFKYRLFLMDTFQDGVQNGH